MVIHLPIVGVDGHCHPHFVDDGTPVAIGIRTVLFKTVDSGDEGALQHLRHFSIVDAVAKQFAGIYQIESLKAA